jgi:c-di-GMP-binding flagellar brake protein YcgR
MAFLRFRKDRQAQDEQSRHLVQRSDQIEQILSDLKNHVQFLTIGPDHKSAYPSVIQEIKAPEKQLFFDHVNDVRGHEIISNSKEIIADATLQGVRIHFRCQYLTNGSDPQGHGYYATSFPEKLYYFQRRNAYRIPLWQSLISFTGLGPQGQLLEGNLYDLSLGGLGLHTTLSTNILQGQDITKGQFELPDATIFMCDLNIGHVRHDRQGGYTQIGCRFIDMSRQESQRLARKIAHLEREQLQRRSRKG